MKISNKLLVALATTLATFTFTFPVHAEWRVGGQIGYVDSELAAEGDLTDGSEKENGTGFGIFGQWRTAISDGVSFGVHFGYGQNGTDYKDSATAEIDLQDFGVSAAEDVGDITLDLKAEQGNTLDLLGVVAWDRDGLTPFVMFGYTTVELDSEFTITGSEFTDTDFNATLSDKDSATLKGYKLVAGVEGGFSQDWVWHAALEYVDYGDEKLTHTAAGLISEDEVELDHTGIRFGIAYTF